MATQSSILAWKIPWTEESGWLQSMGLQRVRYGLVTQFSSVAQSCPTLCDPMNCVPPDSSVHGISQARLLEWVAIFISKGIFPTQEDLKNALLLIKHYHLSLRGVIIFLLRVVI